MVRYGKLINVIKEVAESPTIEKASFILPFIVIIIDIILIEHAIRINEHYIIALTTLMFFLSLIEIIIVTREIHEHYQKTNYERILTIKLDDFILKQKQKNVKILVEEFLNQNPHYTKKRSTVYHLTCQILETHKEEALEETLKKDHKTYIKRRKKQTLDDVVEGFLKKHQKYRKHADIVYEFTAQLLGKKQ